MDVIKYLIEQGAGGKKIFAVNKKEQNVVDIAQQWCDFDSYKVLKDHFDSVTPPKVCKTNLLETGALQSQA